jgi:non-specific serine/threonine protein kinase
MVELESRILADDPDLRPVTDAASTVPSPVTELIGREREVALVAAALEHRRLVTLTGPGGVGKTSIAVRVAHQLVGAGRAVSWVELGSIREPELVTSQMAAVLGLSVRGDAVVASLRAHLRMRPRVIVFDDCDLVVGALADLASQLVVACPEIEVLATSREALRAVGEQVIPIGPLRVSVGRVAMTDAGPAVELFVARARDVDPSFSPSPQELVAVSRICRGVDGLPLAIELAATRIGMCTPTELATQLDHRLDLLTSRRHGGAERHDSLTATMRWSYDQLTDGEQLLLDRLSVFAGPFRVRDAEAVCGFGEIEPASVLDLLAELVVKSFVARRAVTATASFQLLDTIGEFATLGLERRSETEELADRHAHHFTEVAESIRPVRRDLEHLAMAELDIVQAADHYIAEQDWSSAAAIRLACIAELLEIGRAHAILDRAPDLLPHIDALDPSLRAAVLWGASNFTFGLDETAALLNAAIEAYGEAGMSPAGVRLGLGMTLLRHGLLDEAVETLERALIELHDDPSSPGRVTEWDIRRFLAKAHIGGGHLDEARHHLERCAATDQSDWTYLGEADLGLAELMRLDGDLIGARDLLLERIEAVEQRPLHEWTFDCYLYGDLARIELALGLADDARAHIARSLEILGPIVDIDVYTEDCEMIAVGVAVAELDLNWLTAANVVGGLDAWVSRWGLFVRAETMEFIAPAAAEERSDLDPARFASEWAAGAKASPIELIERILLTGDNRLPAHYAADQS